MQTNTLTFAQHSGQPERISYGIVEFQITDLQHTVEFWSNVLGLYIHEQDTNRASLGTESKTLFVFNTGASRPVGARQLGMYHVAIGVPDQAEFSHMLARLISLRISISPTDHLMAKSIYFTDPDGLEIEITLETPERFGRFGDMSRELTLYDANGNPHNGRSALDTTAELRHAQGTNIEAPLSDHAYIAHLHFRVNDLEATASWFEGLGFARNLMLPHFGFGDMCAGAAFTHRLAMNTWAGPNRQPAPADMARLIHYTLYAHDTEVIANAKGMQRVEGVLRGRDPCGIDISLIDATGTQPTGRFT